jgi:hypothetical protein
MRAFGPGPAAECAKYDKQANFDSKGKCKVNQDLAESYVRSTY